MSSRSHATLAAFLSVAALGASCGAPGGKQAGQGRTLVLITVEGLRADRLKPYGGGIDTPALARLAAAGTTFTDVVSVSPMSRPSVSTILTGVPPDKTQVRDNAADRLPDAVPTVAERARGGGWSTGAFVGSPTCGPGSGLDRGFELFDAPPAVLGLASFLPPVRPASTVVEHAATWLAGLPPRADALAWVHLGDLGPLPSSLDDAATADEAYGKAVGTLDGALGTLLDALAKRGKAEVMVVSTHGIYLGEDKRFGDAFWLDPMTLQVPLIWSGGRAKTGKDEREVWLPDLGATLAASAGVSLGPASEGADLGAPPAPGRKRYAWSWYPDDQLAWPTIAAAAKGGGFEPQTERPATPRPRVLSAAARQRIEATGVRLGTTPKVWVARPEGSEELIQRLGRAYYLLGVERDGPARVVSRQGLLKYPDDLGMLTIHLHVMHRATREEHVKDTVERLERSYFDRPQALHWLAHYEGAAKHPDRAEALTLAAAEIGPKDADLLYDLACARSIAKDVPAALDFLKQALDAGYQDWNWLDKDPDLAAVRADPGYGKLRHAAGR